MPEAADPAAAPHLPDQRLSPALARRCALLGLIWASTAFVQVPLHDALEQTPDAAHIRGLVASNWVRTVAWTARAILIGWALARLLQPG
jgi:hypothetical protein